MCCYLSIHRGPNVCLTSVTIICMGINRFGSPTAQWGILTQTWQMNPTTQEHHLNNPPAQVRHCWNDTSIHYEWNDTFLISVGFFCQTCSVQSSKVRKPMLDQWYNNDSLVTDDSIQFCVFILWYIHSCMFPSTGVVKIIQIDSIHLQVMWQLTE